MLLGKIPSIYLKSNPNSKASSGSFWDPSNYKETTKRVEDGEKLVRDCIQMVEERKDIENEYAKQLQAWSARWENSVEKGQEYGTMETAWRAVAMEGVKRANIHLAIKDDVDHQVVEPLQAWHKETYHKQRMQLREKKELDDQFKTAQKEWSDLMNKEMKSKTEYMTACKEEKKSVNAEREATKNPDLSQSQVTKLQEKIKKSHQEVKLKRENYTSALQGLRDRQNDYEQGMIKVFNSFKEFEEKRCRTIQTYMLLMQDCLNVSGSLALPQIYAESCETIKQVDHSADLLWWSDNHGVNMEHVLPEYLEYDQQLSKEIELKKHKKSVDPVKHPCEICWQMFDTERGMRNHIRNYHQPEN